MQTLGRVLLSQLRPQVSQSSPALTAAAVAAGGWLSSIRFFSSEGSQRLYIGNLSFEATQEEIQQAFEKFGPVHDVSLIRRPDGRHKGFGFVELDAAAAEAAIQALDQSEFKGRNMQVKVAEPKLERGPGGMGGPRRDGNNFRERAPRPEMFVRPGFKRLYVGNLNFRTTAADLGQHFQQFGAVQDCVIPLDGAGRSKGFGFVELDDQGAEAALKALDGATFDGREIRVREQQPR